jgi:L-amino acid N-acyltransferase
MKLRAGLRADLPGILSIMNYYIEHSTTTFDLKPKTLLELESWFSQFESGFPILVAELEQKIVGYAYLSAFRPKAAYKKTGELSIYLEPNSQGRGFGKDLMNAILEKGESLGYHTILSFITSENRESITFHQIFGFVHAGQIKEVGYKHNRWLDVSIYQKLLK